MNRKEYITSLQNAIDAIEAHLEHTKGFIGSPVEKTIKFQELMSVKNRAYHLMIEELDVLCREDMRKGKQLKIMSQEQQKAFDKRIADYAAARRKNES